MKVAHFVRDGTGVVGRLCCVNWLVVSVLMVLSSMFKLYLLLLKICFMLLYSVSLSVSLNGHVINRLTRYLIAAFLCSGGRLESLGMMLSVAVGFL